MRLYFTGHDYKYAAEQMLLTLFPEQRPEYPEGKPDSDRIELKLSHGDKFTTASCRMVLGGKVYHGRAAVRRELLTSELLTDRYCQRLIKNAMYRAALASGVHRPAWGALTGVRPGKIFCSLLAAGLSEDEATRRFIDECDVTPERAALCRDTSRETVKAVSELGEKDVCLYVGIPFCPTRCAYCSFVSQSVEKSMKLIPPFMNALIKEVSAVGAELRALGLRVVSIYMGGGTPTTLNAAQLDRLCTALEREFDLGALREYTVEAGRPDTITEDKLRVLRAHGVDRVSVNPQTMSDSVLETIGRRHSSADIVDALEKVRAVGGFAVNMDLIAGLPSDSADGFRRSLDQVLELGPENVTVHTLTLKKGSRLMTEGSALPSGTEVAAMLDYAWAALRAAGQVPYYLYRQKYMSGSFENVGWCRPGTESLYNICMMEELHTIVSLGGGGMTKLIDPPSERIIRQANPKYPQDYLRNIDSIVEEKQRVADFFAAQM